MAKIPMYGQEKEGGALGGVSLSGNFKLAIDGGTTLTGDGDGGIVLIEDADASAIVLPTITQELNGLEYTFIMGVDAGGSITITSTDSAGNFYQGALAVNSVDSDNGFAANGTTNNIITMNATTTGGLLGSRIHVRACYGHGWAVWGSVYGTDATGATPFSG
tara:strand:- start:77 stop:562 length:486 start_codon:yes stop_codon:yes gene_type:complete